MGKKVENVETKRANMIKVVRFIYSQGETSKQEIAANLGLSMPTVLQNVKELVEGSIVVETGEYQSTGGRKAKMLSIREDAGYAVGLDITLNHISFVLLDARGMLKAKSRIHNEYSDTMEYYKSLGTYLDEFLETQDMKDKNILGVGVSLPGIIEEGAFLLKSSHVLGIGSSSLRRFSQFIKYETCFMNDASAAAYAEMLNETKDMVYLSLSNSVGGAFCLGQELYMGHNFKSGEFGHMIIQPGGKQCYCGKEGCLDSYCSANVLARHTEDDLDLFFTRLKEQKDNIQSVWNEYLNYLAIAITNLRMAFDCDIILGGYVGGYLDDYLEELDKSVLKYNKFDLDASYLKTAVYKKEASAIGVGLQFVERFFDLCNL